MKVPFKHMFSFLFAVSISIHANASSLKCYGGFKALDVYQLDECQTHAETDNDYETCYDQTTVFNELRFFEIPTSAELSEDDMALPNATVDFETINGSVNGSVDINFFVFEDADNGEGVFAPGTQSTVITAEARSSIGLPECSWVGTNAEGCYSNTKTEYINQDSAELEVTFFYECRPEADTAE
ncbi:MAG: hypothetical protein CL677_03710 [Bdellovibrionaceae bacterium]|nr:hypothetical protein [Pseudobdellovibrionaceae bacterium]